MVIKTEQKLSVFWLFKFLCSPLTGNKRRTLCFFVFVILLLITITYDKGYLLTHKKRFMSSLEELHPSLPLVGNASLVSQPYAHIVICMILTRPSNWESKGKAVQNTWAKRCNKAIFFYSKVEDCSDQPICQDPDTVGLDVPDDREHLTAKTLVALSYSYIKYGKVADYFLKADDDTYVIMENLQFILSNFSSTPLLYLGRMSHTILPQGYNSGGAGYILSNQAAKLIVQNGSSFPSDCRQYEGYEDVEIGKCLARFGIYPQDDLDSSGKLIFHSNNPLHVLQRDPVSNFFYINLNGAEFGNNKMKRDRGYMLSNWTATMHYVSPPEMYMYEFLLYHLRRESGGMR